MVSTDSNTYVFWRENNQRPFVFAGVAVAEKVEDTTPVKVIWLFETGIFPDEVTPAWVLREGAVSQVSVNAYERNPLARRMCIEHYGTNCFICGFNFGQVFGELGEGFIHVHHLRPLSEIGEEYKVDPVQDMRPVCPNCHAMIHRRSKPLSIKEMQSLLQQSGYERRLVLGQH
jgi:hypothetical protein